MVNQTVLKAKLKIFEVVQNTVLQDKNSSYRKKQLIFQCDKTNKEI